MLTGPEKGMQRQALLRVIAAILHFTAPESNQVERSIREEATAIEDPVGTALVSTLSAWDALQVAWNSSGTDGAAAAAAASVEGGGGGGGGGGVSGGGHGASRQHPANSGARHGGSPVSHGVPGLAVQIHAPSSPTGGGGGDQSGSGGGGGGGGSSSSGALSAIVAASPLRALGSWGSSWSSPSAS